MENFAEIIAKIKVTYFFRDTVYNDTSSGVAKTLVSGNTANNYFLNVIQFK